MAFSALEFIIFILILQQIEGNLIYPKVVGKSIGLPGIWVLAAITIGGGIMGIPGMLIAVPLFSAGYRLLKEDVAKKNGKATVTASKVTQLEEQPEEQHEEIPLKEDTQKDN